MSKPKAKKELLPPTKIEAEVASLLLTPYGFPPKAEAEIFPEPTEGEDSHYARSMWPKGPWDREVPDKIVWVDPPTNLDCMMIRGPMGNWCGYVGISTAHPWHGINYSGCINRHSPKSMEQKEQEALAWLKSAEEKVEADPSDLNKAALRCAELAAKPFTDPTMSDSFMRTMDRWSCTSYEAEENGGTRCKTPESILEVHGGVTYSDSCGGRICHTAAEGRPHDVWWFGFDCCHSNDVVPGMLASSRQMREKGVGKGEAPGGGDLFTDDLDLDPLTGTLTKYGFPSCYRDITYVKAEVESLAQQLKAVQNGVS